MTKGHVRLTPENCPEHDLVFTLSGNLYWVYQCKCGYWETREGDKTIARYSKKDDQPGKAIRINYKEGEH